MEPSLEQRCRDLMVELALGSADTVGRVEPLPGGIASEIAVVELGNRRLCAKFALPKLKVAEDWYAPVHRNRAEYEWLRVAAGIAPESAVRLFGHSDRQQGFAMEYLDGEDVYLWKPALLHEAGDRGEAELVGDVLGRIHAASAAPDFDTAPFLNRDDFRAIRIEPYLTFTGSRWPQLTDELNDLANMLFEGDRVLVHGDVSPKNIFFRRRRPVLLDAECATMGDASFDVSFCLNHLMLKALHLPGSRKTLFESVLRFWNAYASHVVWEPASRLEERVCHLVLALMLARVDSKSPVEYLDRNEQDVVRALAVPRIKSPPSTLLQLTSDLAAQLEGADA